MEEKEIYSNTDEFLISQVCEILKSNNIRYIRKDEGVGSYLNITWGYNINLKRVFVSSEDYEKAKDLIEIFLEESDIEVPKELENFREEEEEELEKQMKKTKKLKKILFVCIPIIMIVTVIIVAIITDFI